MNYTHPHGQPWVRACIWYGIYEIEKEFNRNINYFPLIFTTGGGYSLGTGLSVGMTPKILFENPFGRVSLVFGALGNGKRIILSHFIKVHEREHFVALLY